MVTHLAWNGLLAIQDGPLRPEPISLPEAFAYYAGCKKSFWGVFGNGVLMDFRRYIARWRW